MNASALVRGRALMWASDIALRQNDFAAAREMADASVKLLRHCPDAGIWLAASLINLASALHQHDQDEAALPRLEEALSVARRLDNSLITAVVLNNLAECAIDRGDYLVAEEFLRDAVVLQQRLGQAWGVPYCPLPRCHCL